MKALILTLLVPAGLLSQTITVTSPTAGQTLSGISSPFTSTLASAPNTYSVEYDVNGEIACITYAAPWSCVWNTFYVWNNIYNQVTATVYNALNVAQATSSPVTFAVNNTNWPESAAVCSLSVSTSTLPTSTWSGTVTPTLTGSGSNCSNISTLSMIDGKIFGGPLNTTLYDNGIHTVVFVLQDLNTNIQYAGQWEKQINFQNGATPMELRAGTPGHPGKELWLCTLTQTNCPTSYTITTQIANTDGTFSASSGISCASGNTAVATVTLSGTSCIVTEAGIGSTQITITDGSGRTVLPWVHVNTANQIASFGTDGAFHTSYVPGVSLWITDLFNSQGGFTESLLPAYFNFGKSYASIYNVYEGGLWVEPQPTGSQSAWQTAQTAYVASTQSQASTYGLYFIGIGDSAVRQTGDLFTTARTQVGGIGSGAWSPTAVTYTSASWTGTRMLGVRMFDEGNTIWGSVPLAGQLTIGSTEFPGPIVCTTGTCTVTGDPDALSNGAGAGIIIRGATTHSGINSVPALVTAIESGGSVTGYTITNGGSGYTIPQAGGSAAPSVSFTGGGCTTYPTATATLTAGVVTAVSGTGGSGCTSAPTVIIGSGTGQGVPYYYVANLGTPGSYTFPNPGIGAVTITTSSDPGLVIEQFPTIAGWFDAQYHNPPSTSPASDYVRYNAFSQFVSQWRASGANYPLLSWGVAAGYSHKAIQNWIGDPAISNFATFYISPGQDYLPQYGAMFSNLVQIGFTFRDKYSVLGASRINFPIMAESGGTNLDYGLQGYSVAITSISGNLITFTNPHGISNVLPANTRLWITGASNSAFNSNYYVMDCPNATQCHVAFAQLGFDADVGPATATFSNGDTIPVNELGDGTSGGGQKFPTFSNQFDNSTCSIYKMANHRGQTVTFTGASIAGMQGPTFWYVPYPLSPNCDGSGTTSGAIYPLPTGTSTGGTAHIILSQAYVRGINYVFPSSEAGPRELFNQGMYYAILPSAGTTAYQWEPGYEDPRARIFADQFGAFAGSGTAIQTGVNAIYLQYGNQLTWISLGQANKIMQRLAPLLFGQNVNGQDLGQFIECTGRTASAGNYVGCLSFSDGPTLTRTIDLSGCAVAGQAIEKIVGSWRGITISSLTAGTTSDSFAFNPDTADYVGYACWQNYAASAPTTILSARLADVPSAAKIVVQYAYLPDPFQQPIISRSLLFPSFDCGAGTCTLPVDKNIGTVYYRLVYLASNGAVLAVGDVQTL